MVNFDRVDVIIISPSVVDIVQHPLVLNYHLVSLTIHENHPRIAIELFVLFNPQVDPDFFRFSIIIMVANKRNMIQLLGAGIILSSIFIQSKYYSLDFFFLLFSNKEFYLAREIIP